MPTKTPLLVAAGALCLMILPACRGGDNQGHTPVSFAPASINPTTGTTSRFSSTDQGAELANALVGSLAGTGSSGSGTSPTVASGGRGPSSMLQAGSASGGAGPGAKALAKDSSQACSGGGTATFTDDTGTAYTSDGVTNYANCQLNLSDSSSTGSLLLNGRQTTKCTDSAQTSSSCNATTVRLADGAAGSTDFVERFTRKTSSSNQDFTQTSRVDATDVTTNSGATDTTTVTGTARLVNNLNNHQYAQTADGFRSVSTTAQSGTTASLSGGYGITSNTGQCNIGKVTVATNTPLVYGSGGGLTAGKLTLTDGTNQAMTLEFASDGSLKVTLANGTSKVYTAAQVASLCQ